jgi:hypothetical protein
MVQRSVLVSLGTGKEARMMSVSEHSTQISQDVFGCPDIMFVDSCEFI